MNRLEASGVHVHVTIVLDWKMTVGAPFKPSFGLSGVVARRLTAGPFTQR